MNAKGSKLLFLSFCLFLTGIYAYYYSLHDESRSPASSISFEDYLNKMASQALVGLSFSPYDEGYIVTSSLPIGFCGNYNQVEFKFIAPDVRVSGSSPELVIVLPCSALDRSARLPLNLVLKEEPGNLDLEVKMEDFDTIFRVRNVIGMWPNKWELTNVRYLNTITKELIYFDERHLTKWLSSKVYLKWK